MPGIKTGPLEVGDTVWVDGWGPGKIVAIGDRYGDGHHPWARVEQENSCTCKCGHSHRVVESTTADFMHVHRPLR